MIAFLDSSALIYYFEGDAASRQAIIDVLQAVKTKAPQAQVAVSRLGVMECRVKPLREANSQLLARYDTFFQQVQIVELSAAVVDAACVLRASTGLKTPDALQAACALSLTPPVGFVTGYAGFARVPGLTLLQVQLAKGL